MISYFCIWFHMYMKSYVLAMIFHVISYVSSRLPRPVQMRPRAGSKDTNASWFESNAPAARPHDAFFFFAYKN